MEVGRGSRSAREPKDDDVLVENASSGSEMSLSTASNATLKDDKTTNAERKKEEREEKQGEKQKKNNKGMMRS